MSVQRSEFTSFRNAARLEQQLQDEDFDATAGDEDDDIAVNDRIIMREVV